jgi:hypothetical protein
MLKTQTENYNGQNYGLPVITVAQPFKNNAKKRLINTVGKKSSLTEMQVS